MFLCTITTTLSFGGRSKSMWRVLRIRLSSTGESLRTFGNFTKFLAPDKPLGLEENWKFSPHDAPLDCFFLWTVRRKRSDQILKKRL